MVLIVSAFGPTWAYKDKAQALDSLEMFLDSLQGQTSRDFKLFISVHDRPDILVGHDFAEVETLQVESRKDLTFAMSQRPLSVLEEVIYEAVPTIPGIVDCYRKLVNSTIAALRWAYRAGLRDLWLLRVDADDLLYKNTVLRIERADAEGWTAVYANNCYLYEPNSGKVAKWNFRMPISLQGYRVHIGEDGSVSPAIYLLCRDHAHFTQAALTLGLRPTDCLDYCLMRTCSEVNHVSDNRGIGGFEGAEAVDPAVLADFGVEVVS